MKELFSEGYEPVRKKVKRAYGFSKTCFNCEYFYRAKGDKDEMCQNDEVIEYDMVVTENNIHCSHWRLHGDVKKDSKEKKIGRAILD